VTSSWSFILQLIVSIRNLENTPINKLQVTKYGDGYMLPDKYNNSNAEFDSEHSKRLLSFPKCLDHLWGPCSLLPNGYEDYTPLPCK